MKRLLLATTLAAFAAPAFADEDPTPEQIARIDEVLADMTCEVDPDNIEVEDDGSFDLDDVMCADGQYDIKLNADFTEKERRKE
ncbi:PepSY domain-containing protein [Paracoccus siganidrum]|uniref:PepSY domain-containing protein n=1 Tax=Paracoccus siganidrum TaxID=1276757 RepID=A0A419A921_9RHOB|nr:PepSY domain-containing protein [Paracoccus siganidrum]RJL18887.1 PepSY domain-containing protein [Paracoccus siganidrum]RMC30516.1 PepSY domain-containing protein [Paracoccus siganidrum]